MITRAEEQHNSEAIAAPTSGQHAYYSQREDNLTDPEKRVDVGKKRSRSDNIKASKKSKIEEASDGPKDSFESGTIERGHIYFLYRPRVQVTEAHSIDDIKNLHILLVPGLAASAVEDDKAETVGRNVEEDGNKLKKHFRLISVGKKKLPTPRKSGSAGRKETFWATVTAVGNDLHAIEQGFQQKTYDTKTKGRRHEEPARLVARGAYALVNNNPRIPSQRETHLGYCLSHPSPDDLGDVHKSLGICSSSSFIIQVKNPLAPAMGPQQAHAKSADYPEALLRKIFGKADRGSQNTKGREAYGLRFAPCGTPELLDYEGAQLLLFGARYGESELEESLDAGRGKALIGVEEKESSKSVESVFKELDMSLKMYPAEAIEGKWV